MNGGAALAGGRAVPKVARLSGRGAIRLGGGDALAFLQNIVTSDLEGLAPGQAVHAGLLSPQGKILFAFFVVRHRDELILEAERASIPGLVNRLQLYRLRAKVEIDDVSDAYAVVAAWAGALPAGDMVAYADPRLDRLGQRALLPAGSADATLAGWTASGAVERVDEAAYDAHRIANGVPVEGRDYALGDTFPHEALFDQLGGVSFSKGCFVGQEVVSRMQHRGTARKRIVPFVSSAPVASGVDVMAGTATIGRTGSVAGCEGLALVRLDRAAEAGAKGIGLTVDGEPIRLRKPDWAGFDVPET
ncbi:MAG: hypothetical protein RLZ98_505 [Pseudomonadota bacterium]|jgi:folate-binding protein YgfZ